MWQLTASPLEVALVLDGIGQRLGRVGPCVGNVVTYSDEDEVLLVNVPSGAKVKLKYALHVCVKEALGSYIGDILTLLPVPGPRATCRSPQLFQTETLVPDASTAPAMSR